MVMRIVILFLLIAFFPPSPGRAQEKKQIRVIFTSHTWTSSLPFRAALTRGFFKAQGLTVEPIFIRGGPAAIAALVSGSADFGTIGGAQAVIRTRARGLDLQVIGSISNRVNYVIIGDPSTKTVEDMKGKTIGVTGAGAFSDFAMRVFLKGKHIDPDKDVALRAIGATPLRATALERGLIAAAPFAPEDAVYLLGKGFPLIANLSESLNIPQAVIVARSEYMNKYPETTKRFLKALILGMQVARNKPEAIRAGYAAGLKGDPETVSKAYDLYSQGFTADLSVAQDGIQIMLDDDIRNGIVDRKLTLDQVIDERILKIARKELQSEVKTNP
jgi:ABC-type nitrate/sulfonate/bicarbonate transport system substrate-binding protein